MVSILATVCLGLNIYHEARGEAYDGKAMVAIVTLNRANYEPRRVCKEVSRKWQFSWFNGYHNAETLLDRLKHHKRVLPKDETAWNESYQVAKDALEGNLPSYIVNLIGSADHYFNPAKANPAWQHEMQHVATVGNHVVLSSR